jgi:precorrin-6A/cobalt-precorrin-6A reductase
VRVLILGGTGQARLLADTVADTPGLDVITSLAGRVSQPRLPAGSVRVGGFGGVDGLTDYLRDAGIDRVVDATHPFAARITTHAMRACARTGIPLLVIRPPGWTERDDDRWHRVGDTAAAASAVADTPPGIVLLTIGRLGVAAFAADAAHDYLIRSIHAPDPGTPLPARRTLTLTRGPFSLEAERALLRDRQVSLLVTKDSGGTATAAKLTAARELGVPVVMIDRPALPPGVETVPGAADAAAWLAGDIRGSADRGDRGTSWS